MSTVQAGKSKYIAHVMKVYAIWGYGGQGAVTDMNLGPSTIYPKFPN